MLLFFKYIVICVFRFLKTFFFVANSVDTDEKPH